MAARLATAAFSLGVLAAACHDGGAATRPADDGVEEQGVAEAGSQAVAWFGDLEITVADVDARILALPPAERLKPGQEPEAWYEEQVREVAVERRLLAEATDSRLAEDEAFLAATNEAEKRLVLQLCLAELRPQAGEVTPEALQAAYEERLETFSGEERRNVYHLFLRRRPDVPPGEARHAAEALRDRVLGGESFQRLATETSDSETRHNEGALGWMTRGQLPAGFEEVIFRLEEGVPSDPVATRDGFHLFYVDHILPARRLSFDEARPFLVPQLLAERREAALAEIEAETEPPAGSLVLDRAGFDAVLKAGDPEAVVLRLGSTELTLAGLRHQLRQSLARREGNAEPGPPADRAWHLLAQLRRRELVYDHCQAKGKVPEAELEAKLADWRRDALVAFQRQRRLLEVAGRDEERLRRYYESNVGDFSKPPQWRLRRLRIPLGDGARAAMARLESAAASRPSPRLEELRAELGGEIEDLEWKSFPELTALEPKMAPLVAPLEAGELSPPYRAESTIEIVETRERREAEPLPFEEVRERIAAAYVRQYTRDVYRELAGEILQTAELRILPDGLAALRDASLPAPEVSVEELEALLDEL